MSDAIACHALLQADIAALCTALTPASVCCFDLPDLDLLPLDALVRSGAQTLFVDSRAGRVEGKLTRRIGKLDGGQPCLACDPKLNGRDVCASHAHAATDLDVCCRTRLAIPRDPMFCTHFAPGRRLRVIHGDAMRGRGAGFVTRAENVVARARTPHAAVRAALVACERTTEVDVPLPIGDGAFELVISLAATPQMLEQSFGYFDQLMERRFGPWTAEAGDALRQEVERLRAALFRRQVEALARELARVTDPVRGRVYFATTPVAPSDGGWMLRTGVGVCFDVLATWFAFDFDSFAPEAFLRRCDGRGIVQSAVLRRKRSEEGER